MTLERVADGSLFGPPLVVTGAAHRHLVETALEDEGVVTRLVVEPDGRDTAPAIAAAATLVDGGDLIMVLAADHLIRNVQGFRATAAAAAPVAEAGHIVLFGVTPDGPTTHYGYIRPGEALGDIAGRQVLGFAEKPDAERARSFVANGYLWNSGIFLMRAGTVLSELERHAPEIVAHARDAVPTDAGDLPVVQLDADTFGACPRISIDYAVMEKTDCAAVVDADFDWSDLGTWSSVWSAGEQDAEGNVSRGDVTILDSRRSLIISERFKVGVVGLDDAVVVASDEAVLVTSLAHADRVKDVAKAINAEPEKVLGDFTRHARPWGSYQALDLGPTHQVKRLVVNPGKRLSLQRHRHRTEHWTVVQGAAEVTIEERIFDLGLNESALIPLGAAHRLANRGDATLVMIEVQCGDYLGEDDIVRLEDDFGRSRDR